MNLAEGTDAEPGRLRLLLTQTDPGGIRWRQAFKTVLAVSVALLIFGSEDRYTRTLATVSTAFFMQTGEGTTRRQQWLTFLVSSLAMTALATLSSGLADNWIAESALLVTAAFLSFYLRRFAPRGAQFPIFGFTLCLLSSIFPGGWSAARQHLSVELAAIALAAGVFFFVLPPSTVRAFRRGVRSFSHAVTLWLLEFGREWSVKSEPRNACTAWPADTLLHNCWELARGLLDAAGPGPLRAAFESVASAEIEIDQSLLVLQTMVERARGEQPPAAAIEALQAGLKLLAARFELLAAHALAPGAMSVEPAGSAPGEPLRAWLQASADTSDKSVVSISAALFSLERLLQLSEQLARGLAELPES